MEWVKYAWARGRLHYIYNTIYRLVTFTVRKYNAEQQKVNS